MVGKKTVGCDSAGAWLKAQLKCARWWIGLSILLGSCSGLLLIAQAYCISHVIHGAFLGGRQFTQTKTFFGALAGIILLRAVIALGREKTGFTAGALVKRQVRQKIMEHWFALGPVAAVKLSTGQIVSAAMEQVEALHDFYARYLPQLCLAIIIPAAVATFVFPVSWAAGLILLITAPLIPLFMVLVGMGAENISQRHFQSLARMSAHFLDTLQGLATLKIFDRSKKETENVAKVSAAYRRKTMAVLRVAFLSSAVLEFFSAMAIAIVAVYLGLGFLGYYQFGTYGVPLTFQQGFFILLLAPEFYSPLKELGAYYHARASAIGAAEEILKILRIRPGQVEDHGKEIILPSKSSVSIQFKDVSVDFGRGRRGLEGVTLKIEAGQKVAIVGPSGAGKSTLIHLLLGFVQPSSGQILIDAFPQSKLSIVRWRKQLAWIGQHPILFPGSILENIRMAAPFADTKEVFKAASAAGVMAFCDHLPGGVETVLGEQGLGLSKGQAQRVALARAYLKNSPLLLLDEPTAGLDHITEQQILKSAVSIFKGRTVLMVTHNETATVRMDRIVRMEQGHVTEII